MADKWVVWFSGEACCANGFNILLHYKALMKHSFLRQNSRLIYLGTLKNTCSWSQNGDTNFAFIITCTLLLQRPGEGADV